MDAQIISGIIGLLGGGTIVGITTLVVNRSQRKATLFETMQKTTALHIQELVSENERRKQIIDTLTKEKSDLFEMYKECMSLKETLTKSIHELELKVQELKNELIKANLFKN